MGVDGGVVFGDGFEEGGAVLEAVLIAEVCEVVDCARLEFLDDGVAVFFGAEPGGGTRVVDLEGEGLGLLEDGAAEFGVGEVAHVDAFVDEADAVGVEHYAEGVSGFGELVRHGAVTAVGGCVGVPGRAVAA